MKMVSEIKTLLGKEILQEFRSKYALSGLVLYIVSTIFVCYLSFKKVELITWNVLFWIILLFASVNAIAKSFSQENKQRQLYYYTIARPEAIILSKIIYNTILMSVLSSIALFFYAMVFKMPVQNVLLYMLAVILGAVSLASTFTMISAIASKAGNNATLMAILGFPVIIPLLILLIKVSNIALIDAEGLGAWKQIVPLLMVNGIVLVASLLLFPYLWRD